MIRSCAWCGREFGCKPPLEIREVTHGICKACEERFLADLEMLTPTEPKPVHAPAVSVAKSRVES